MKKVLLAILMVFACVSIVKAEDPVRKSQPVGSHQFVPFDTSSGATLLDTLNVTGGTTIYSNSAAVMVQSVGSGIYFTVDGTTVPTVGKAFLLEENNFYLMAPEEAKKFYLAGDTVSGGTVQVMQYDIWPSQ